MSKLFEIQKQVLFSDLSNDELELLIKTVAEKRAKNSGKGKSTVPQSFEDSMFLRCCRENRNFTTVNDAGKVVCPCCRSAEIIKYGKSKNGRQRYKCKSCSKIFNDTYGTVAFHSKLPIEKWIALIQYTLMGISCRKTAKNIGVNKDTVLYNRHRICSVIKQLAENKDSFPSMAEGDEFYYPLSFKDKKSPNFFIEVLGRMPYTHRSMEKKYEYVVNAGYDEVIVDRLMDDEWYRKRQLLGYVKTEDLKSQEKFSVAVNEMEQSKVFNVLSTLQDQVKKKRGISNQQVCILTCVDPTHNQYLEPVCVGRIEPKHITKNLVSHFTDDTLLVTDSHRAYKTVANKNGIPLRQIPSGKHTSGGYHLGHVNGYHHNLSQFMQRYCGVSTKYLPNYMALFFWTEKNKDITYQDQTYEVINLLSMQANKVALHKFKKMSIDIDLKGILERPQLA